MCVFIFFVDLYSLFLHLHSEKRFSFSCVDTCMRGVGDIVSAVRTRVVLWWFATVTGSIRRPRLYCMSHSSLRRPALLRSGSVDKSVNISDILQPAVNAITIITITRYLPASPCRNLQHNLPPVA